MNPRILFIGSCVALITSAFTFVIRGDILPELGKDFELSATQQGVVLSGAFWGMFVSMLVGAPLCDRLGMKVILLLAFLCHITGVVGTIYAPHGDAAFMTLFIATFLAGCGNGLVEIAINPLAATLYPTQKTHYLNILHAWWPGGLVLGGLIARGIGGGIDFGYGIKVTGLGVGWQGRMALIIVPAIIYLLICLFQRFPQTERVASGVTNSEMFGQIARPMFVLWAFCMLLTAAIELGPQQWQESVMMRTTHGQVSGTLILVYTSSMMFILRHFAGPLAHALSPVGMLTVSAVLAGVGLNLLSHADSPLTAFGYATIFGLGIAYFWPTMLGVTAERFPKGGALAIGLMGSVGNLSIAMVLPFMGYIYDRYSVESVPPQYVEQAVSTEDAGWALQLFGIKQAEKIDTAKKASLGEEGKLAIADAEATGAKMAFRTVSYLAGLLVVIFGGIALWDKAQGGYKAEILISRSEENELFAGGVQGAVE